MRSQHSTLPTPCVHCVDEHRKLCDGCQGRFTSCYPCLLDGFRYKGREWYCQECRTDAQYGGWA